jgi:tRNA G10  N-methylase Trm11
MLANQIPVETGWDYRCADTKELTHGIHPYPAMMIPQVARRLLREYGTDDGTLFDPFCGTGTTLLEGMLAGYHSIGTDLNPLARLIALVKTTPIDLDDLNHAIEDFIAFGIDANHSQLKRADIPPIPNIDYWFDIEIQRELASILNHINRIGNPNIANFFKVAYSLTVRKASWTKNSEFKLVRMSKNQMDAHDPDVFSIMTNILNENRSAVTRLVETLDHRCPKRSIRHFDTVQSIPDGVLRPGSVNIVVTSPPYGDSKTTVAYGQFSRLSSQWLGYPHANRIDNILLGGENRPSQQPFNVESLDDVISSISYSDCKRASEVSSFFVDYRRSIRNVATTIAEGGYACYVVGNRTVKGFIVPTEAATAAFFESCGFKHIASIPRNIPNKRMPDLNSPSNILGKRAKTMHKEFVVVCEKIPGR